MSELLVVKGFGGVPDCPPRCILKRALGTVAVWAPRNHVSLLIDDSHAKSSG
jgi:hypothetical protein